MKQHSDKKRPITLGDRLQYWFDNHMAKGSLSFFQMLIILSLLLAVTIALLIVAFGFNDGSSTAAVVWNSLATGINAWMPSAEDGSPGYVIMMAIVALGGLLFTSVLIGIITSAIEEKIEDLKRGNSIVLEKDHTVILGFYPGEYTLIQQLVLSADGKPSCIVIAENMERDDMEQEIRDNIELPANFRIVCRNADITDPVSIEKLSLETCKAVIVSPTDDAKTTKTVLAVFALLQQKKITDVRVNAIISRHKYRIPPSLAQKHHITALQTNQIIAKMIAHSCTQTGLSATFREIFNFEGSEFYLIHAPQAAGWTFQQLMAGTDHAVPAGILRDGQILINPPAEEVLRAEDRILVFAESKNAAVIEGPVSLPDITQKYDLSAVVKEETTDIVIFGANDSVPDLLAELPENVSRVSFVGPRREEEANRALEKIAADRSIRINYIEEDPQTEETLLSVAQTASHIIILNNHDASVEEADMEVIFLLINLRDIRERLGLSFNITVEMRAERNQKLVEGEDRLDFLVTSSMSSLILAQLSESPDLIDVFRELLSNQGNELYLKSAEKMHLLGYSNVPELRMALLHHGYIFLGILRSDQETVFNPPLDQLLELTVGDYLIVLGPD